MDSCMRCMKSVVVGFILLHLAVFCSCVCQNCEPCTDLVIFSYNRPMQLYALLESIEKNLTGISSTSIIYRTGSERYERAYQELIQRFSQACFIHQGNDPEQDFKQLTLAAIENGPSDYILFAVDDIIVKNAVHLANCIRALECTHAYGFYLRLGTHLTCCYALACLQSLPALSLVDSTIFSWVLKTGFHDWGYPHTVDMALYRKQGVLEDLRCLNFNNPNRLEEKWAGRLAQITGRLGLCFADSIVVNIPLNLVQNVWYNRNMHSWSVEQLLDMFEFGLKIDINPLQGIKNLSCHIDYEPQFIRR
jgi:hypothetical protein